MGTLQGGNTWQRSLSEKSEKVEQSAKPACPKKTLLTRAIESFYDNCAAYNLRYIPYRTVTDQACLQTILKDFIVLLCFMVTNFVVFLTILSRIAMHLGVLSMEGLQWSREKLRTTEYSDEGYTNPNPMYASGALLPQWRLSSISEP